MDARAIEHIVARAKERDEAAFGELYDLFADRIYKFISFKISDSEHAEDLLQEVFVKAWHGCAKLNLEELNFSAWLYTIAGNTVKDYFRKMYRRPQTISLEPDIDIVATDDTSQEATRNMNTALLERHLQKLPDNYKQVLELRYIQEFSIEETAKILKKNSVSVRVLQHRAVKKLESIFKKHEER